MEPETQEYEMYIDVEMTEWRRLYIKVPGASPEHAQQYARDVFRNGGSEALEEKFGNELGWESMIETAEATGQEQLWYDDILVHSIDEYGSTLGLFLSS